MSCRSGAARRCRTSSRSPRGRPGCAAGSTAGPQGTQTAGPTPSSPMSADQSCRTADARPTLLPIPPPPVLRGARATGGAGAASLWPPNAHGPVRLGHGSMFTTPYTPCLTSTHHCWAPTVSHPAHRSRAPARPGPVQGPEQNYPAHDSTRSMHPARATHTRYPLPAPTSMQMGSGGSGGLHHRRGRHPATEGGRGADDTARTRDIERCTAAQPSPMCLMEPCATPVSLPKIA